MNAEKDTDTGHRKGSYATDRGFQCHAVTQTCNAWTEQLDGAQKSNFYQIFHRRRADLSSDVPNRTQQRFVTHLCSANNETPSMGFSYTTLQSQEEGQGHDEDVGAPGRCQCVTASAPMMRFGVPCETAACEALNGHRLHKTKKKTQLPGETCQRSFDDRKHPCYCRLI